MASVTPPIILWFLLVSSSMFQSIRAVSEFSLAVSGPTTIELSPNLIIEKSPGSKPGTKVKCERILIHGLPRIKHLKKLANSLKVKVSCVTESIRPPNIEVCFHRNSSLGIGMCSQDQWERLTKGLWTKSMSPFDEKILDIRMIASRSEILQVSIDEEFFSYRVIFLVIGILLMSLASSLSKSLVFYYGGAMTAGAILVILIILFQGMKLLPTGRKSSLAIFLYSCFVGLGTFLLRYVPNLLRSLLVEIGLSEDMYDPLLIFLLVFLLITGSWLGFWAVRKLVLKEDGSIDSGVTHFVSWSIRIVASVLILQCSIDPLLAAGALVGGIFVSSLLRRCGQTKVVRRVYKKLCTLSKINLREPVDPYASPVINSSLPKPSTRAQHTSFQGPTRDSETFYSTFHDTPDRRKFTKKEWELKNGSYSLRNPRTEL